MGEVVYFAELGTELYAFASDSDRWEAIAEWSGGFTRYNLSVDDLLSDRDRYEDEIYAAVEAGIPGLEESDG